jgi:MFS family permease
MKSTIHTTKVKLAFTLCMLSYLLGGCISTMMSSYLPVALPDLLNRLLDEQKLSEYGAYINAIFLYGWMCGGLSMGFASDKIGRIPSLSIVTALCGLGTVFIVFVKDWYVLLALRFISGVGVGGILLLTTVYISEIWPEKIDLSFWAFWRFRFLWESYSQAESPFYFLIGIKLFGLVLSQLVSLF